MDIKGMYNCGKEIDKTQSLENKYFWAAYNNIIDMRYFDIDDTFNVQTPLNDFVRRYGSVMLFPNIVNGTISDINIRALEEMKILIYKEVDLPYGIGRLRKDFKFGDPIVIVEGIGDYAALKFIDPKMDVLAMRTNAIPKEQYELYASITNNFLLLSDNDSGGRVGIATIKKRFKDLYVSVESLKQFSDFKDVGTLLDLVVEYLNNKDENIKETISIASKYYKAQIDTYR